jgi:hypothetical protein
VEEIIDAEAAPGHRERIRAIIECISNRQTVRVEMKGFPSFPLTTSFQLKVVALHLAIQEKIEQLPY